MLGRILLPVLFRIEISGIQNIPKSGPLIVVGNHSAIMEVVLMVVYLNRQVEVLGSIDVPHEPLLDLVTRWYGYIPYRRGHLERKPLRDALSILKQDGVLGIFPEGGIWQISERRVQPGVAWLSEKSGAPVLPIHFGGTGGAVNQALKLRRPPLTMIIGQPVPPAVNDHHILRKKFLHQYASAIMDAVDYLKPTTQLTQNTVMDENFSLQVDLHTHDKLSFEIPSEYQIKNPDKLAKLLHYPTILKIFKVNLHLPIDPIQNLSSLPQPQQIASACRPILHYLEKDNPYLLTYRFGPQEGEEMKLGLESLEKLALWAASKDLELQVKPLRRYLDLQTGNYVLQIEQETFKSWM
jgi:1-acyl-sn-glycerol-3-phosphate acyltransferase